MQKIVLFIEPTNRAYRTPLKIGNLFLNRFAIDEDASSEILMIFELVDPRTENKGMDHNIVTRDFA